MNNYGHDLEFEIIIPELAGTTYSQILKALSSETAQTLNVSAKALYDLLMKKEEISGSGIGGGVAIPHIQVQGPTKGMAILATLKNQIDIDAVDGEPVDLVCLVISPERDGPIHLRRLARISRLLRCEDLHKKLSEAKDAEAIRALLIDPEGWLMAA